MRKLFDRLLTACRKWDTDKWVHIVFGLIVSWLGATLFSLFLDMPRALNGLIGVAVGFLVCLWKECYDKRTGGLFDEEDLAAGFVGVAMFYVIYCV